MATNPYMNLLIPNRFTTSTKERNFELPSSGNQKQSDSNDKIIINYGQKDFKPQTRSSVPLISRIELDERRKQDSTCLSHYQQTQFNSYATTVYDMLWSGIEPER